MTLSMDLETLSEKVGDESELSLALSSISLSTISTWCVEEDCGTGTSLLLFPPYEKGMLIASSSASNPVLFSPDS